jgi:hypothetical protein
MRSRDGSVSFFCLLISWRNMRDKEGVRLRLRMKSIRLDLEPGRAAKRCADVLKPAPKELHHRDCGFTFWLQVIREGATISTR